MRTIIQNEENSISWSSILAGVVTTLMIGLIFNLLGAAIGFSVFLPKREVLWPLTISTLLWLILSGIVSLYIGGWVTGYFSNAKRQISGILYGMMVGSISTLISVMIMVMTVGAMLSTSFSVLGNLISASTSAISESASIVEKGLKEVSKFSPELSDKMKKAMPDLKPIVDSINQKAADLLSKRNETAQDGDIPVLSPEKIKSQLNGLIHAYLNASEEGSNEEARNKLIDFLAQETGKNREEIEKTVKEWYKMYVEAKEKIYQTALESSKKITKMISQIALVNFFILLSGVIAAAMGAVNAIRNKYNEMSL